jgi:hypothetical protein
MEIVIYMALNLQVAQLVHNLVDRLSDTPSLHPALAALFRSAWPRFYHFTASHTPAHARAALATTIFGEPNPTFSLPETSDGSRSPPPAAQPFYLSAAASPENPPGLSLLFATAAAAACAGTRCAPDGGPHAATEAALDNAMQARALCMPPRLRGMLFSLLSSTCLVPVPCACRRSTLNALLEAVAAELPAAPPLLRPETLSTAFLVAADASRRRTVVAARLPVDPSEREMVSSSFAHGIEVSLWLPAPQAGEVRTQTLGAYVNLQHACMHNPRQIAACIGIAVASEAGEAALEAAARHWCEVAKAIRLKPRPGMWATKLLGNILVAATGVAFLRGAGAKPSLLFMKSLNAFLFNESYCAPVVGDFIIVLTVLRRPREA